MFDDVPTRVWLLIVIGLLAFRPAQYLFIHWAHSPSRLDITQPKPDLSWRTSGQCAQSLGMLAALVALAIFIFTPTAERFAHSPEFFPLLALGMAGFCLFWVAQGFVRGHVEPLIKGSWTSYERTTQPKRFWASMTWNAFLGLFMGWVAVALWKEGDSERAWDRCFANVSVSGEEAITACRKLVSDYSGAISRDPDEASSYYNRGSVYGRLGNHSKAIVDFGSAIRLNPEDPDAYVERGVLFMDGRQLDLALSDFTRAHELDPKSPWPLANRGLTLVWKQEYDRARNDLAAARAMDPANPVMLRGEALISLSDADWETAVERLNESMKRDPDNLWALQHRAWAYRQLGEAEKARSDLEKLRKMGVPTQMSPSIR